MGFKKKGSKGKAGSGLMRRKYKNPSIRPGMQLGELYVLQKVNTKQGSSGGQKWRLECSCGRRITVPQWYLMRREYPKRDCGCVAKGKANPFPRERGIWYMMHRRCYNDTHVAYSNYGGANPPIRVCDRWNKDVVGRDEAWTNFITDMGPAPCVEGENYTLDRIDPYGPYHPDNCRWASHEQQMNNLKIHWAHPDQRSLEERMKLEHFDVDISDAPDTTTP